MFKRVISVFKRGFNWIGKRRIIVWLGTRVNFLIDGSRKGSVRRMMVPRWSLILVTIFFVAFLGVAGYAFASRVKIEVDRQELDKLRSENKLLDRQYSDLEEDLDSIYEMYDLLSRHDIQLRVQANMNVHSEDVQKLGIGGPSKEDDELKALRLMASGKYRDVKDVSGTVEELLRKAEDQGTSFTQIKEKLTEDEFLRDHTPSIRPCNGWQCSGFGYRIDPYTKRPRMHNGVDISNAAGTPILASADGEITYTGFNSGYGLAVKLDHGNGIETYYAHLSSILVSPGAEVKRGQVIGLMGATGRTTGTHLHYEVRVGGTAVNPLNYIIEDVDFGG
ncbi:peptidoglycan DD-metalloendopeptidase family protein [candidate division WOR-3 bacterium]|nr:peptidoglycan DD-metalloendopeptidase family protein [candidate division WOR-3 bacterium]